jgi:predicted transcriptional regulator
MRFSISENLTIDYQEFRDEGLRISVLARSGGGKSNLVALMVEQALEQGIQVCIIEPIEEWFTLKTLYDSIVWVGEDGDLPLIPEMAHIYTKLLEDGASLVLTVATGDEFRDKEFVASFLWSLYSKWRRIRRPMMLVFEEADAYAPQMWSSQDRLCLTRVATIAKRGRKLGINPVFISQRPADIHKTVVSQSNVLFIGGFKTSQDLESVKQLSKLIHLDIPTDEVSRLNPGEFYAIIRGEIYKLKAYFRKTPHGGLTPEIQKPIRADLESSVRSLRETLEKEIEKAREEQNIIKKLMRENEELKKKLQEYEEQLKMMKIVKEMPIELKVTHEGQAINSQEASSIPEVVYRCRYPGAVKVYQYLSNVNDYVKLKDIANNTGIGMNTVKKIIRFLKKKGLVRVRTISMYGKNYIKSVKLRRS